VRGWRRELGDAVIGWHRVLMVDAPLGPLRTGRQPRREDQIDWSDGDVTSDPVSVGGGRLP
jgi:hypothetical protein